MVEAVDHEKLSCVFAFAAGTEDIAGGNPPAAGFSMASGRLSRLCCGPTLKNPAGVLGGFPGLAKMLCGTFANQPFHANAQRHVGFLKGLQLFGSWLAFPEE
jgi:hypothetical protein